MPCAEVFDRQDRPYQEAVLPRALPRVAIEAGVSSFWRKYVGLDGAVIGIDRFGESAPAGQVFDFFGFTVTNVVTTVKISVVISQGDRFMTIKVGINGFGRIGRMVFRAAVQDFRTTSKSSASTTCSNPITWRTCSSMIPCIVVSRARLRSKATR
jgi:hypothetical protein